MILLAVAVSAVSALAFSARKTPIYEATAKVFIGPRSVESGDVSGALEELTLGREFLPSYAQLLQSQPVAEKVIAKENLPRGPEEVAGAIEARVIPDTRIIEVKYTDIDPQRAQKTTNTLVELFVNEELQNLGSGGAVAATVLEPAQLPSEPISPKPLRDGVLGLVLGLALGVGMAFLLQQLDTTLRTREDVEEALSPLPVLAGIPKADGGKERTLFFENDTRSPASEAIRTLRTNIQFFSVDNPIRLLLVTSPYAEDGKTTVAANLGAAIAASGVKTLLVEADLRRPALREYFDYFEPEKRGGLTDVLAGIDRIKDVVRKTHIPNLYFLPAGSLPPNPSELLGSHKMEEVLEDVRGMADVVVIDTPPALAVADSLVLGSHVDGVALVIRAGVTHRERSKEAKEVFERAGIRLLGMVLNDLDLSDAQYYYRYYQRYTPRHRQMKQAPAKVTRPIPEMLSTSGLEPSPPPSAVHEANEPEVIEESSPIEAVAASIDEVTEKVVEATTQDQPDADEDEEGTLAKLRAIRRLMEDEDLLKKVSAADQLVETETKPAVLDALATASKYSDEMEPEIEADAEPAATVEMVLDPQPEGAEIEVLQEPELLTELELALESAEEIVRDQEPDPLRDEGEPLRVEEPEAEMGREDEQAIIAPLFPPEANAPGSAPPPPDRPEEVPTSMASPSNGPPIRPQQLDPEVVRMMREEEDEYEDDSDLPTWMLEPDKNEAQDSLDDSEDLEALGVDVTHLTPKQRKRLRKRIHRLGPEAARDFR